MGRGTSESPDIKAIFDKPGSEPPDIKVIFDKPGRCWFLAERRRVDEWLYEPLQYNDLLRIGRWHRGVGATLEDALEDAKDAWGSFYLTEFAGVVRNYDPHKGLRFWGYLKVCFKRYCWKKGKKIQTRVDHEVSLDIKMKGEYIEIEIRDTAPGSNPEELAFALERCRIVQECINELEPKYRQVILLYYFEEMSVKEIATELGIPEGNVGVHLYRARQKMKKCLKKEGIIA